MFLPSEAYNLLQIHILIKQLNTQSKHCKYEKETRAQRKLDNVTKHVMGGRDVVIETKESFYK